MACLGIHSTSDSVSFTADMFDVSKELCQQIRQNLFKSAHVHVCHILSCSVPFAHFKPRFFSVRLCFCCVKSTTLNEPKRRFGSATGPAPATTDGLVSDEPVRCGLGGFAGVSNVVHFENI